LKRNQTTLAREVVCAGVGLFEGNPVRLLLKPAPADHGVVFVRTDLASTPSVRASVDHVVPDLRRTTLQSGDACVSTVEHLLAACAGLRLDNALVLIDGPEPPALDGSALPFVRLLQEAGLRELDAPRRTLVLDAPVSVQVGDAAISATPSSTRDLQIAYQLCYPEPGFIRQDIRFRVDPADFVADIAPARTYVLRQEIDALLARGLGKGANEDNVLVVEPDGSVSGRARFDDEPVRHKVLDLLGDLFLLEADLVAQVGAVRSGHALNHSLVKELKTKMDQPKTQSFAPVLDIDQIRSILPHRYPFLLVDRVIELEPGKRALGYKNVTANEHFFVGHFPEKPLMPGVLQLEAMAQLAGVLMLEQVKSDGKLAVLLAMDEAKFRRAVVPGDRLMLEAVALKIKTRTGQVRCTASVEGQIASEVTIKFMLVDFNGSKSNDNEPQ